MAGSKQHTIPQFYLRPFLSPGYLFRKWEERPLTKRSPKGVAVELEYYGVPVEGHTTLDDVNDKIEDRAARTLRKIFERPQDIDAGDLVVLRYFVANLAVRTPAVVEAVKEGMIRLGEGMSAKVEHMKEVIADHLRRGGNVADLVVPSLGSRSDESDASSMPVDDFIAEIDALNAPLCEGGGLFVGRQCRSSAVDARHRDVGAKTAAD